MDTLVTFAKENFQLIILLVSLLGVIIACIGLANELKARKRNKSQEKNNG